MGRTDEFESLGLYSNEKQRLEGPNHLLTMSTNEKMQFGVAVPRHNMSDFAGPQTLSTIQIQDQAPGQLHQFSHQVPMTQQSLHQHQDNSRSVHAASKTQSSIRPLTVKQDSHTPIVSRSQITERVPQYPNQTMTL